MSKLAINFNDLEEKLKELNKLKNIDTANNLFKILIVDDFEIRHSNFLKWLFSYKGKETKNFNRDLLISYLSLYISDENLLRKINNEEYEVYREQDNIDLRIEFETFIVVIENKWQSKESENQLSEYYNFIKEVANDKGKEFICIFLTLYGDEPIKDSDKKVWKISRYRELLDKLKKSFKKAKSSIQFTEEENLIIQNYIELLEEKTMRNKTTTYIKELLKVYEANKDVLDDIVLYKEDIPKRIDKIEEMLNSMNINIERKNAKTYLRFGIRELKEALKNKGMDQYLLDINLQTDTCLIYLFINGNIYKNSKDLYDKLNGLKLFRDKGFSERNDGLINLGSHKYLTGKYLEKTEDERISEMVKNLREYLEKAIPVLIDFVNNYDF